MEYILSEEFLRQSDEVKDNFIEWWKPEIGDMIYANGIDNSECIILGYVENDRYFTINLSDFYKTIHTKNTILPLFTEGGIRKFIEDKTDCYIESIPTIRGYIIVLRSKETTKETKRISVLSHNFLQVLWQVACKIASEEVVSNESSL